MKIERLIEIFEQLLSIYEKGYKEKYCSDKIYENDIQWGLCMAAYFNDITKLYSELSQVFKEYYKNLVDDDGYIFPRPDTWQDLKPRIDFMKSEIKDLKKLLKQGYTHV